jgi:hypothetical protein
MIVRSHSVRKEGHRDGVITRAHQELPDGMVDGGVDVPHRVADRVKLLSTVLRMRLVLKVPHQVTGAVWFGIVPVEEIPTPTEDQRLEDRRSAFDPGQQPRSKPREGVGFR